MVKSRPRVFLSYSVRDGDVAARLAQAITQTGALVAFDQWAIASDESISRRIDDMVRSSDYFVVLLSVDSVRSRWVQAELSSAKAQELSARDITIVPVRLDDCEIPPAIREYQVLDLRDAERGGIGRLLSVLRTAPSIDLQRIPDPAAFEALVADLLTELGFAGVRLSGRPGTEDNGVDVLATYTRMDPFGAPSTETWAVQVKHHRHSRASVRALDDVRAAMDRLPAGWRCVVVTTGQLTSAARQFLADDARREIRVVDGVELKRLLAEHPDVVERHFGAV